MVMIFADVWKTAPFMALLVLAGLQVIPGEIYEAAKVDGATAWQRFTKITLPLLKPAILVALIFRTLDALRIFDLPYVLTKGAHGTNTLSLISYETFGAEPLVRRGLRAGDPDVPDRDGGVVPVHPLRRRQPTRNGGGLIMEAASVPAAAEPPRARQDARRRSRRGRPGGCGWRSSRSSCSACSRSTGWSTRRSRPVRTCRPRAAPAQPDARQLRVDLQRLELHDGAAEQRDRRAGHHGARR